MPTAKKWNERVLRSGYFFAALVLHLILFVLLCTFVIFPAPSSKEDATFQAVQIRPPPPPPAPPAASGDAAANPTEPTVTVTPPTTAPSINHISTESSFSVDVSKMALPNLPASLSQASGSGLGGAGSGNSGTGTGNPFGTATGSNQTLVGTLYDFTRTQDGTDVTMASFREIVNDFVAKHWQPGSKHPCYISPNKIYTRQIFVPVTPDEAAGVAFKSPQSSKAFWLVHYQVDVSSNLSGKFRFIGFGDNVLIVAIDGTVVLDASDLQYLKRIFSKMVGQMDITGPGKGAPTPLYSGAWFDLETAEPHHIDILIGDEGGVTTSGLFIQSQDISTSGELTFAPNGAPKTPLFVVGTLSDGDKNAIEKYLPPECFKSDLLFNGERPSGN